MQTDQKLAIRCPEAHHHHHHDLPTDTKTTALGPDYTHLRLCVSSSTPLHVHMHWWFVTINKLRLQRKVRRQNQLTQFILKRTFKRITSTATRVEVQ